MTNKYLLTVDGDPVVICNTIEQAVAYIVKDPHLNKVFTDWYEEEKDLYGEAPEYQEYIKHSIQVGDNITLEAIPALDNIQEKKRYVLEDEECGDTFGLLLSEEQVKFFEWLSDNDMLRSSDILFTEFEPLTFEEV